jgi:hypothetical protein
MKMIEWGMIFKAGMVAGAVIIGIASSYLWYPDNPIEEHAEVYIYQQSGLDVDVSPGSPEGEDNGNAE